MSVNTQGIRYCPELPELLELPVYKEQAELAKVKYMNKVRITAMRQTVYADLMAQYENAIEHTCDVAWSSMREFVESLARGEGNFFDGWMKNPMSAMISCNDGFRPLSFYLEVI